MRSMSTGMMRLLLFTGLLLIEMLSAPSEAARYKLPSSFKRCELNSTKQNDCLEEALQGAFHVLKDGLPSLGVFPIDPLFVERINIEGGGTQSVRLSMYLKNLTVYGLSETKVVKNSARLKEQTLSFKAFLPLLNNKFSHEIDGKVLVFPMRGSGPGSAVMNDLQINHTITFSSVEKKDGRKFWQIDNYILRYKPKVVKVEFLGLFPENKRLGDEMTKFMAENSDLLFDELGGYFEDAFAAIFKEIGNQIFKKFPMDEIFIVQDDKKPH